MKQLNYALNICKYKGGHASYFSYLNRGRWGRKFNVDYKVIKILKKLN